MNFTVNFYAKNRYRLNYEAMSTISVLWVKFTLEFTGLAMNFCCTACKRKQAHSRRANGKGKKAISESTVNSHRIGITVKLEAIKKLCHFKVKEEFYWYNLFHLISENKIIHILMYFFETRQVGLEQEMAKSNQIGRTSIRSAPTLK